MSTVLQRATEVVEQVRGASSDAIASALLDAGLLITDFQFEYRQRIRRILEEEGL